jgi:hypothetical protein
MGEFCHAYFQPLATDNDTYLLPEKSIDSFYVNFVANGQLSALIDLGGPATFYF